MNLKHDDEEQPTSQFSPFDQFCFESYQALLKDRTILFNGEVGENAIERVVLPLTALAKKSTEPIKLMIHSEGGDFESGQAVVDAILTSRAPVVTIAMGNAMSAAFDIFLAGAHRVVYPNTILMVHAGSTSMSSQTLPQINQEAELHKVLFIRWAKWYASRTKMSEKEWLNLLGSGLNKYIFPEEAIKQGIAHQIIPIVDKKLPAKFNYKF